MSTVLAVCGLAFGDEGKGTCVDFLTRVHKAHTVIRFSGGAQCAHNVVLDDGTHHTFAQFGSGTLAGASTHLSRFMLVNPSTLLNEARALERIGVRDPFDHLTIDGDALVTTSWHITANRIRERMRGDAKHGTCGMGIGETASWGIENPEMALRVRDLENVDLLKAKLSWAQDHCSAEFPHVDLSREPSNLQWVDQWSRIARQLRVVDGEETRRILKREGTVIFEGAQGVLLDESFGFQPHTTWSKTTFENADVLIKEGSPNVTDIRRVGVLRSYMTRHGAGPLVTESALHRDEPHNGDTGDQGAFRTGELDFPALTYALRCVAGVDELAVTHMDRIPEHVCLAYTTNFRPDTEYLKTCRPVYHRLRFESASELLDVIQSELAAPVTITSWGPQASQKMLHK